MLKLLLHKFLGWHDFGPWKDDRTITLYGDGWGGMTEIPTGYELVQIRRCKFCGIASSRRIEV